MNPGTFRFTVYGESLAELERLAEIELEKLGGTWLIYDFDIIKDLQSKSDGKYNHYRADVLAEQILTLGE